MSHHASATSSVADTLKQLNATTFSAKYPDFGSTSPAAVASAPLPAYHAESAATSSFPWLLIIGLIVGVAITFFAVKMWSYWRNSNTPITPATTPTQLHTMTPPAETLIQELARQMVQNARPAANTPFLAQTVPMPATVPSPTQSSIVDIPGLPMTPSHVQQPTASAAQAPDFKSDPNFEPL